MDLLMAPGQPVNLYFEYDLILASIFLLVTFTVGYYAKMENDHIEELRDLANVDALTGLFNHRYFYATLYKVMDEAKKNERPVSLLFFDIDDFKLYNDLYGHTNGDDALKRIAQIIMDSLGTEFVACRYGGEEFAVLMYNIEEDKAMEYARYLCNRIANEHFYGQEYLPTENLTVSVGVSEYPQKANDAKELVAQADEALYRAKFFRKNRVESYTSILDNLRSSLPEQDETIIATLRTLISVINSRDKYTYEHVERVAEYAGWMANELEFPKELRQTLIYGAYLHDIGKINTPKEVLLKSDKLTETEWDELKCHPAQGVEIIEHVEIMKDVQPLILQHHEQYDGKGYPKGLKDHEIAYLSRILSVVDAFDAMTSLRPYQKKRTIEEACKELIRCKGTQFDPDLVDVFIGIIMKKFDVDIKKLQKN
ncbi:MAG: diguanylate cyclase [Acetobacterium sp.]